MSTISRSDAGYGSGMFGAYQAQIDQCIATMDVIEMPTEQVDFNAYPNPASTVVNVEFELNTQNEVTVSIINTVGQTVAVNNLGTVSGDRKSTRLNSSHVRISYAVFCLKKKKK